MKQKLLLLVLILISIGIHSTSAQEVMVRGMVVDEKQLPLPGANIVVKGTTVGTVTDIDGNFSINVPNSSSVLVISFLGYFTQEIAVNNRNDFSFSMVPNLDELGEVVVVGYGTQRKIETTGAISSVKSAEIMQTPVANVAQGLQGRVAGL